MASCADDNTIKIWNTTTWSLIKTFSGHTSNVNQIDQIDSDTLVSVSLDKTYRVWSISTGAQIKSHSFTNEVYAVKMLTSDVLALGLQFASNNLLIFNWTTGTSIKNLNGHSNTVFNIEILDSQYIASASADKDVIIWDLYASESLKYTLTGHSDIVFGLKLLSQTLLASGAYDNTIIIWNWKIGSLVRTLTGHDNFIWLSLDIFSDNVLISGSLDSTIKFWNITNGNLIQSIQSGISISTLTMVCPSKSSETRFFKINQYFN
jgi:WD40 repeat protein